MRFVILAGCAGALMASVGFVAAQHGSVTDPRNGSVKQNSTFQSLAKPPADVIAILERSCSDCHSEQTRWPWYSHLPVIGKQMEQHVAAGRLMLDLSDWKSHIEALEAEDKLDSMCIQAKSRKMPLPPYLLLHPQSRLTDPEIETLCKWTASRAGKPLS